MKKIVIIWTLYLLAILLPKVSFACSDLAGSWEGHWSETSCDGWSYSGSWTGELTSDCVFTGTDNWDFISGSIDPATKLLTATGVSRDGCGTITVTATFTNESVSGRYFYSNSGGGSFTGKPILLVNPSDIDNDGYTENQGDCNDNDGTIYPGAAEICGDGIDQDCDGKDLACSVDYDPGSYNYYLPYFRTGGGFWSGLGLANRNPGASTQVRIMVYDAGGNSAATEYKTIPAYGQDAFPVAMHLDSRGWMWVNSHQPLSGLAFLGSDGSIPLMVDIPFISQLSSCLVIPHVAQDSIWDTTILICNPAEQTSFITLKNVDKAGVIQDSQEYTIPAHGSEEYPLAKVFTDSQALVGRVEIYSSTGVAAFALYSDQATGGSNRAGINAAICTGVSGYESAVNFSGQLDVIEVDSGSGVYSGTAVGTPFFGVIDAQTANGKISDGSTITSFGCCLAAGGLTVTNNSALNTEDTTSLNSLAGYSMFNVGDLVDIVNIEGDVTTSGGGRLEIGLSYIFAADTFSNSSLDNYPFDPDEVLLDLFFIVEENADDTNVFYGLGKLN